MDDNAIEPDEIVSEPEIADRRRGGRPTALTAELAQTIIDLAREGNFASVACSVAGVSRSSFYSWRRRGARGEQPYRGFLLALEQAEAIAESGAVATIRRAADAGVWQASAWFLERSHGDRWGRRLSVDVETTLKADCERLARANGLDPAELLKGARQIYRELERDGA